jgi:hypothetical protein
LRELGAKFKRKADEAAAAVVPPQKRAVGRKPGTGPRQLERAGAAAAAADAAEADALVPEPQAEVAAVTAANSEAGPSGAGNASDSDAVFPFRFVTFRPRVHVVCPQGSYERLFRRVHNEAVGLSGLRLPGKVA